MLQPKSFSREGTDCPNLFIFILSSIVHCEKQIYIKCSALIKPKTYTKSYFKLAEIINFESIQKLETCTQHGTKQYVSRTK